MDFPVSLAARVRELARVRADEPAYLVDNRTLDWRGYDQAADRLARALLALRLPNGATVAVWVPDGPAFHIAFQATERAGLVCLGLGARCGERELAHLLRLSGARTLLSAPSMSGVDTSERVESLRSQGVEIDTHLITHGDAFECPRRTLLL